MKLEGGSILCVQQDVKNDAPACELVSAPTYMLDDCGKPFLLLTLARGATMFVLKTIQWISLLG